MIIDIHTHIGNGFEIDMNEDLLLHSMSKYNISFALVSNADGCEFDMENNVSNCDITQADVNLRSINLALNNKDKIGVYMWARLQGGECDQQFKDMTDKHRDIIYGIKIHPYFSRVPFNDIRVEPYIQFASEVNLPLLIHTEEDGYSNVRYVYEVSKKYPNVRFIMSHLGCGTDHMEAITYLEERKNLYTDTAWIRPTSIKKIISDIGYEKIMFGTDNPTFGIDTYAYRTTNYIYLNKLKEQISSEAYQYIMYQNAINFFNLS